MTPIPARLRILKRLRRTIATEGLELARLVRTPWRMSAAETLAAEVLPLADAIHYLEREAELLLRPRRRHRGRPFWMRGVDVEVHREPLGLVLVLGPSNYPLFLPAVQAVQALAAGNAVWIKPAPGADAALHILGQWLRSAGLPAHLFEVLGDSVEDARRAIELAPDHMILTGSADTGRAVLRQLAEDGIPATLELSGCDAVFLLPGASLDRVARALVFGMSWNRGATCIAPRRVFGTRHQLDDLAARLAGALPQISSGYLPMPQAQRVRSMVEEALNCGALAASGAIASGAMEDGQAIGPLVLSNVSPAMEIAQADVMAPILSLLPCGNLEQALDAARRCPYALGAAIFGDERLAAEFASRIPAGVVTINDLIAPAADPRVPFGGSGASGYGVTRGAEGLLALTRPKTIVHRRGKFLPHLDGVREGDQGLFASYLKAAHGPLKGRVSALAELLGHLRRKAMASP